MSNSTDRNHTESQPYSDGYIAMRPSTLKENVSDMSVAFTYADRNQSHAATCTTIQQAMIEAGFQVLSLGSHHLPYCLRQIHTDRAIRFLRHFPDYLMTDGKCGWLYDVKTRQNPAHVNHAVEIDSHETMMDIAFLGVPTFYVFDTLQAAWSMEVQFFRTFERDETADTAGNRTAFGLIAPDASFLTTLHVFLERLHT